LGYGLQEAVPHSSTFAEDIRYTQKCKDLYKKHGETIERVFADAKEKHGMRYTQYRGLKKVQHYLTLLFACMNLKSWRCGNENMVHYRQLDLFFMNFTRQSAKL
jgi:hypothetical protein